MDHKFSSFAERFLKPSGTKQLMEDLSEVAKGDAKIINLGGGNPGLVSQAHERFRERIGAMLEQRSVDAILRRYDGPQGHLQFRKSLAAEFSKRFGWPLNEDNVALTAGSQTSFFMLFNAFAGRFDNQQTKKVMLPLAPEYIGYADVGLCDDILVSKAGVIETTGEHRFKYHLDFDLADLSENIGLVCISRPTNPTGNVITNDELAHLMAVTAQAETPLIIDGAYGLPFPNIVFTDAEAMWQEHVILCLSLSKLGLPGLRTGVVIADPEVIQLLSAMNAILSLANNSFGAELVEPLLSSGEVFELSNQAIKPFYAEKARQALQWIDQAFEGISYLVHESEGAIFLWLWFPGLPIADLTLYERLKSRGVLVLPGSYFFPNHAPDVKHQRECIRLSYAQEAKDVQQGIHVIAQEVRRAFKEAS